MGVAGLVVVGAVCLACVVVALLLPPPEKTPPSARPTRRRASAIPSGMRMRRLAIGDCRLRVGGSGASQSSTGVAVCSRVCASGSTCTGARLGRRGGTGCGSSNQSSGSRGGSLSRAFIRRRPPPGVAAWLGA